MMERQPDHSRDHEMTDKQLRYVRALQRRLRLPDFILDNHCVATYGKPFLDLTKQEVSRLLDDMEEWQSIPADLMRQMGQRDLPGLDGL